MPYTLSPAITLLLKFNYICTLPDVSDVYRGLTSLENLIKQACDILECRVEAVLEDMSLTPLCDIPEDCADTPITVETFLQRTEETSQEAAAGLAKSVKDKELLFVLLNESYFIFVNYSIYT